MYEISKVYDKWLQRYKDYKSKFVAKNSIPFTIRKLNGKVFIVWNIKVYHVGLQRYWGYKIRVLAKSQFCSNQEK